ncbi:MAG: sensor histidine kinase [Lachnospira sp.]
MNNLSSMEAFNTAIDIAAAIVMLTMVFFIIVRGKNSRKQMSVNLHMLIYIFLVCSIADAFTWYLLPYSNKSVAFEICLFVDYISFQLAVGFMHLYIIEIVKDRVKFTKWMIYIPLAICTLMGLLWVMSKWNGLFFTISDKGYLHSQYFIWSQVPGMLIAIFDLLVIMLNWKKIDFNERIVYICYATISTVTDILGVLYNVSILYMGFAVIILIMYVQIDVEKEKIISQQKTELVETQSKLMVSQIKPHFIYNTLSTISELCHRDPLMAEEASNRFASYLRVNLHSLESKEPVPFIKELEHVKTYLWIEKLRFEDEFDISYHIGVEDFMLPSLTIQPLVENCVKHGMMGSEEVCHIDIVTEELEDCYKIVISDDGIGFDLDKIKSDEKNHLGLSSVEQRLFLMSKGTLHIKSRLSEGTVVTIEIPKESV